MRVSKLLKVKNISSERFIKLLNSSEWNESKWRFDNFGLNSNITTEQLSFLEDLISKSNEDDLMQQIEIRKDDETNIVKQINNKTYFVERFYGDQPPIEIPENVNQNLQKGIKAYLNVVLFISYNIKRNYSNTIEYFSSINNKKVNLLNEEELIRYHCSLLRDNRLKRDNWEIVSMIHQNMEGYKIFNLVSKILEKAQQPFDAAVLILKYRKIHLAKLHEIKYSDYPPYKKLIDEKEYWARNGDNNFSITSSSSVYSLPNPFRN